MSQHVVGIAIGATHAVVWIGGRAESVAFDSARLRAGDDTALQSVMESARRVPGATTVAIALDSPWSDARLLSLPPMRVAEAAAVVRRDAARHFPTMRDHAVVTVQSTASGRWIAADADGVVLDAIVRASRSAGFAAVRIVPTVAAWASVGKGRRAFLVDERVTELQVASTGIVQLRRCRRDDRTDGMETVAAALAVAARACVDASGLELVAPSEARHREQRTRQVATRLWGAAMVTMAIAIVVAVRAELGRPDRVAEARRAIAPQVAPLLVRRDSLTAITEALSLINARYAPRATWSSRLQIIQERLPARLRVQRLQLAGDSLILTGSGVATGEVVERLRGATAVVDVQLVSSVDAGDTFRVSARFRRAP